MGFYLGPEARRRLPEELAPVITPGEYSASLSGAIMGIMEDGERRGGLYGHAVRALADRRSVVAVRALSRLLNDMPRDLVAHRTLGVALLHAGNLGGASRHLEICLGLSRRGAMFAPSLEHSLRAHLDGALARLVLLLIYMGLGQRESARTLALEGLIP